MSPESIWFYELAGERHGPAATAEVLALYGRGEISSSTLVWREGLADWTPFSASELASAVGARPGPPAMPPVLSAVPPPVPRSAEPFIPRAARLRPGFRPSIRDSYGRAWELLKTRFWPFVGCFALASLILSVASQFYIPIFFLMFPIMGGLYWYILRCVRGKEVTIEVLFEGFRRQFGPLAIANLIVAGIGTAVAIVAVIVIAIPIMLFTQGGQGQIEDPLVIGAIIGGSFLLFFVFLFPLMILGVVGTFATLLILDCEIKAGEALALGWRATKPHLFKFLLFMLVNAALSFAGMLALYVGMFITGAWASIALVYLYEDAFGEEAVPGR